MTDSITQFDQDALEQLDTALNDFEKFLNGDGSTIPSLRENWIYLQIFATYGLRLPSTSAALQNVLNLTASEAASYSWFNAMREAYAKLDASSQYFFSDVFNNMTSLGTELQNFTTDVAGEESEFTLVATLVTPGKDQDLGSALDVLENLQQSATKNVNLANTIKQNLGTYKAQLTKAQSESNDVKASVDKDDRTSQKTVDKLDGDKNIDGSIKQLQDLLTSDQDKYRQYVAIAATTPTYSWVIIPPGIPAGLITAVVIAGVYGDRAVKELDTINKVEAQIKTAQSELHTALAVRRTVSLAENSLTSVLKHLQVAIDKVTAIQNAWQGINGGLEYIKGKVNSSLRPNGDDKEKLAAAAAIKFFMKQAQTRWTAIQPVVEQMVKDPFITVDPNNIDIKSFLEKVKEEVEKK